MLVKFYSVTTDWTIVRPGGLMTAPATGKAILTTDNTALGAINRADVASLVGRQCVVISVLYVAFAGEGSHSCSGVALCQRNAFVLLTTAPTTTTPTLGDRSRSASTTRTRSRRPYPLSTRRSRPRLATETSARPKSSTCNARGCNLASYDKFLGRGMSQKAT